jgi:cell division protein FtsW
MDALKPDYYFLRKQAIFAMAGVVALVIFRHIPYKIYQYLAYPMLTIAILFLIAIQVTGFGVEAGGAVRWFRLGLFSFQPSELARFAFIVYLAYSLSKKKGKIKDFSIGFLPHFLMLGIISILIIIQPNFGTVVIISAITWLMLFAGGVRFIHLLSAFLTLPIAYYLIVTSEYRLRRFMSYLDPWQYPTDQGYQIIHSLMAFGTGGLWGTGIGKGYQKLFYLPEPHTDFIFSVIGEEFGLIGVMVILGLYGVILWRGISIARRTQNDFGALLALGLTVSIGFQVCVNMSVALNLLPTTGLTLPFISYGGTSLLLSMAAIGVLMNIGLSRGR